MRRGVIAEVSKGTTARSKVIFPRLNKKGGVKACDRMIFYVVYFTVKYEAYVNIAGFTNAFHASVSLTLHD